RQRTVAQKQAGEIEHVAGVHFAGMDRAAAGEVERSGDGDAADIKRLARAGRFAVAATLGREVDDHAARLHARHHVRTDDLRCRPTWHRRSGHDHVDSLEMLAEATLLFGALVVGKLARVTALARGADTEVEELAAQRLDLLAGL